MFRTVNSNFFYDYGGGFALTPAEIHDQINNEIFCSDEFRMYGFKIKRCPKTRSHDWTECPFAHRGEKAQRRDPRKFHYSAIVCPAFRNGKCFRGDSCEFAHGVFEYWLHPARYRTRACNAGILCQRKVCFFAHTPEQLRSDMRYRSVPHLAYRVRIDGGEIVNAPPLPEVQRAEITPGMNRVSEFLKSLRKLKIKEMDESENEFPDTNWIWELLE